MHGRVATRRVNWNEALRIAARPLGPVILRSLKVAQRVVEAAPLWNLRARRHPEMPLPYVSRLVAGVRELLRDERHLLRRALARIAVPTVHLVCVERQSTSHERSTCGRAHWECIRPVERCKKKAHSDVYVSEEGTSGITRRSRRTQSGFDQSLRIRSVHIHSVPTNVRPAEIIRHEEDDVRLRRRRKRPQMDPH